MTITVSHILSTVKKELQIKGLPETEQALGEAYARLVREALLERLRHCNRVLKDQKTALITASQAYELGSLYPDSMRVHADLQMTWKDLEDDLDRLIQDNELRITHHQFNLNRKE